jgi:hypothetical protein
MGVELWANHMDKAELLLGTSWGMYLETIWELNGISWEDNKTLWEHIENKGKKSLSPLSPFKKKKTRLFMSVC